MSATPHDATRTVRRGPTALVCLVVLYLITALVVSVGVFAIFPQPNAPSSFTNVSQGAPIPGVGANHSTEGGTISTITIEGTTQNPRWKGFVGNISGTYSLRDASNSTIYSWNLTAVTGEVYATRKSTLVDWDIVRCANESSIYTEEQAINFTNDSVDRINRTFSTGAHHAFYAGTVPIAADTCPRLFTYVNSSSQNARFDEILLYDESYLVYATLVNSSRKGFDNIDYNFQMILPDYGDETLNGQVPYYFYVELI